MTTPSILVILPLDDHADPHTWHVVSGRIVDEGPLSGLLVDIAVDEPGAIAAVALVPAEVATYRRIEPQGLPPQQEIAVARLTAQDEAIGQVFVAAAHAGDGKLVVSTIDRDVLQSGLVRLERRGLAIAAVAPMAGLVTPDADALFRLELGGHALLRTADIALPDEPGLAGLIFGERQFSEPTSTEIVQALAAFAQAPTPDFLEGMPTRKVRKPILSAANQRWAKRLLIAAALLLMTTGALYWAKLQWAIFRENNAALTAAQRIDPTITDIAQAEAGVDTALARQGIDRATAAMLAAILWQSTKTSDNLIINDLSIGQDNILKATLSAPDADNINKALLSIQRAGYRITATPRRDQSGLTLVDLTVQAP